MKKLLKIKRILDLIEQRLVPNEWIEVSIDRGQKYLVNPAISAQCYMLFLTNRYGAGSELESQKLFSYLVRDGYIVVDVGAHFGFYTLIAAERVGNSGLVLAFEPSSFNYHVLLLNIKKNRYKNIIPFNFALGDKNTKCRIGLPKNAKSGENTMAITDDVKHVEEILVKRFDSIYYELVKVFPRIRTPDVVKIDVEGAEVLVLKGFGEILDKVKYVLCEVHPSQMTLLGTTPRELLEILKTKGFKIFMIKGSKLKELRNPNEIKERIHIVAVNSSSLNIKYELLRFSYVLQKPYTLVKETNFSYKNKLDRYYLKLIHYIKSSLFRLRNYFYT